MVGGSKLDARRLRALDCEAKRMGTREDEDAVVFDQATDRARCRELVVGVAERIQDKDDVEATREALDLIQARDAPAQEARRRRGIEAVDVAEEGR